MCTKFRSAFGKIGTADLSSPCASSWWPSFPESDVGHLTSAKHGPKSIRGFTLIELLIVVGIIGLLLVLMAPAFTTIKGGTDVTSAAYTIKGVLDTARTYAKANNTYTWVGFFEEDASRTVDQPSYAGIWAARHVDRCVKRWNNVYTGNLSSSVRWTHQDLITQLDSGR